MLNGYGIYASQTSRQRTKSKAISLIKAIEAMPPSAKGGHLFRLFKRYTLTQQMRARDCAYQGFITDQMRAGAFKFGNEFQTRLKFLSPEDVAADASEPDILKHWNYATILVEGNHERVTANYVLAQQFAKQTGQVMITWDTKIEGDFWQSLNVDQRNHLWDHDLRTKEIFVRGAPCQVSGFICLMCRSMIFVGI